MLTETTLRRALWFVNVLALFMAALSLVWVSWISLATYTKAVETAARVSVLHSMMIQPNASLPGSATELEVEALRDRVHHMEESFYGGAQ